MQVGLSKIRSQARIGKPLPAAAAPGAQSSGTNGGYKADGPRARRTNQTRPFPQGQTIAARHGRPPARLKTHDSR